MRFQSSIPVSTIATPLTWLIAISCAVIVHLIGLAHIKTPVTTNEVTITTSTKHVIGLKKIVSSTVVPAVKPSPPDSQRVISKPLPVEAKLTPAVHKTNTSNVHALASDIVKPVANDVELTGHLANHSSVYSTNVNSEIKADYHTRLLAWLERHKRYPSKAKRLGYQGVLEVEFTIDKNGNLLSYDIIKPSPYKALNQAAENMVKRASPMPAIPKEIQLGKQSFTFVVPVSFTLKK